MEAVANFIHLSSRVSDSRSPVITEESLGSSQLYGLVYRPQRTHIIRPTAA